MRLSVAFDRCSRAFLHTFSLISTLASLACRDVTEPAEHTDAGVPPKTPAVILGKTVHPQMDTYLRSDVANKNYGSNDSLRVQKVGSSGANRVLVAFGQSAIVDTLAGGSLISATLELTIKLNGNNWGSSGRQVAAHRMTRAWMEGGATWSCANDLNVGNNVPDCSGNTWTMASGTRPYVTTPVAQALIVNGQSGVVSLDVTSDVQAFLAGQATNHGWLIKLALETQTGTAVFWSRQAIAKPRLVLSYNEAGTRPPLPDDISWPSGTLPVVTSTVNPSFQYHRTVYAVGFSASASDQQMIDFLDEYDATIIGGTAQQTAVPLYVIQVPDPGASFAAVEALVASMGQETGVVTAGKLSFGEALRVNQRFPVDAGLVSSRSAWFDAQNTAVRPLLAVRAPQAWGCETGTYGGTAVKVGVIDALFDYVADDLLPSNAQVSFPPDSAVPPQGYATADWIVNHGNRVAGIMTAAGESGSGIAGMIWKTDLRLYAFGRGTTVARSNLDRLNEIFQDAAQRNIQIIHMSAGIEDIRDPFTVARFREALATYLDSDARRLFVMAAPEHDPFMTISVAALATSTDTSLKATDKAVAQLLADPAYRSKILVVTSADSFGMHVGTADVWTGADMIAAPGTGVVTLTGTSGISNPRSGTSYAAPFVSGVAAQLWTMDPALTASQVKDYILNGALVPRIDPTTGGSAAPGDISVPGIYQLDAYGSLSLMSKQRAGTPICGFPVSLAEDGSAVRLERTSTESVPMTGAVELSVAQGGRRMAVTLAGAEVSTANEFALQNGAWSNIGVLPGVAIRRYLERDSVDYPTEGVSVTIRRGSGGSSTLNLFTILEPTASPVFSDYMTFSPDGNFVLVSAYYSFSQGCLNYIEGTRIHLLHLPSSTKTLLEDDVRNICGVNVSTILSDWGGSAAWSMDGRRFATGVLQGQFDQWLIEYATYQTRLFQGVLSGNTATISSDMVLSWRSVDPYSYSSEAATIAAAEEARVSENPDTWECNLTTRLAQSPGTILTEAPAACGFVPVVPNLRSPLARSGLRGTGHVAASGPARTTFKARGPRRIQVN